MPAGVSWNTYLKFFVASLLSMMAGSQVVHTIYHPLEDLDSLVKLEIEKLKTKMKVEPTKDSSP